MDVSTPYGQQVAESYGAEEFPYAVITDEKCQRILYRGVGHFSAKTWESTLENYRVVSRARSGRRHTVRKMDVGSVTRPASPAEESSLDDLPYRRPFSHPNLDSAISASCKARRGLVVYVTMPGCFYCQKMKAETLVDDSVKSTIRQGFESVIVDRVDEPRWVDRHNITIFPTTLVLSPSGSVIDRVDGYVKAADLRSRLKSARSSKLSSL